MYNRQLFADGIIGIGYDSGVVKIDLMSNSATEKDKNGNPIQEFTQQIVVPLDGFLTMFNKMGEIISHLEQADVVRRNQAGESLQGDKASSETSEVAPKSPNFQ